MTIEQVEADAATLDAIAERLAEFARTPGMHGDDVLRLWRAEHAIRSAVANLARLQIGLHVDRILRGTDADHT